jgi:carbon monoxide dehydrogenase subunit G
MDIQGERRLIAGRDAVWRALNDLEVLRECIPGCQKLERVSDTVIEATIAAQIGPVKAPFSSRIELKDLDPPRAYTLVGEGKSAAAGFGRGEARVTLEEEAGVTTLRYTAQLKLGGKIAQIGARLVEGATRQLADQFFTKFAARFEQPAAVAAPPAPIPRRRHSLYLWILIALAGLLGFIYWLTAR